VRYLAFFRDSFRETVDRKSFAVMSILAGVLILFCASISFRPLDPPSAMKSIVSSFNQISQKEGRFWSMEYGRAKFEISEFRSEELEGKPSYRVRVSGQPADEVNRLIRHWQGIRMGKCKFESDPVPEGDVPADAELQKRFLEARFREAVVPDLEVALAGPMTWDITVQSSGRRALDEAEEMSLLFGAIRWRPRIPGFFQSSRRYIGSGEVIWFMELLLGEFVAGFVGLLVAVIVTAGSVPNMLQKGTLDLLLCRPIGRSALLWMKFVGGCVYVFLVATFIIGGCWLALSVRTGHWNPYLPVTILTLTFFFAVLYSVSVLVGVLTRSHATSAIVTVAAWASSHWIGRLRLYLMSPEGMGWPPSLSKAVNFVYLLLPKILDLSLMNQLLVSRGGAKDVLGEMGADALPSIQYGMIFFSSSVFAVLMLSLACARFSKNDY